MMPGSSSWSKSARPVVAVSGGEGLNQSTTVRNRQYVQAESVLSLAKRGIAGPERHQRLSSFIEQKGIHLVAIEPACHRRCRNREGLS